MSFIHDNIRELTGISGLHKRRREHEVVRVIFWCTLGGDRGRVLGSGYDKNTPHTSMKFSVKK